MFPSVVVPTYERPVKLRHTLDSICNQTADEYEVLVVDDGSQSAEQMEVLEQFEDCNHVQVIRQENAGPAAARNRGWNAARGEVVLFTDDDCIVPRNWVALLTDAFEDGVAAVGGELVPDPKLVNMNRFARAHRLRDLIDYDSPDESVTGHEGLNLAGTANVAYRRSVLEAVGGFDESFPLAAGEDADLQRRVLDAGHEMKFFPVTVYHNDDYDWDSFVSRAIRSGRGTYYFHRKHEEPRSIPRIVFGLVGSVVYFPTALRHAGDPFVAGLYVLGRMLNRWGELHSVVSAKW